ncbi:hypothetical protein PsYK624_159830 [Phanerochaete sordida]|uniref:CxC5 like cysteine cluster associated with KDZ domain-containing protein n=1 Tax=Phanerochaete sordida TaxID=48140 RepID=A0A9P3GQM0_9APHY|nr:hypothetical protein PsYK624_159830 [Phanerochaete sordida]
MDSHGAIIHFLEAVSRYPAWTARATLPQAFLFLRLVSNVKQTLILSLDCKASPYEPPETLPDDIVVTLSAALGLAPEDVEIFWDVMKHLAWDDKQMFEMQRDPRDLLQAGGYPFGHAGVSLWPAHHWCHNPDCNKETLLKSVQQREVVVFTLTHGAVPATSNHLYCPKCNTNYHHNYSVKAQYRTYYDGPSQLNILQVGEHQFVERRLINMWISLMVNQWTSATGCAVVYNQVLAKHPNAVPFPSQWQVAPLLRPEQVWDSFTLVSLLEFHDSEGGALKVPHSGEQSVRFKEAVKERNDYVRYHGLPDRAHCCQKCVRFQYDERGVPIKRTACVVVDGVTIGHPCCASPGCEVPLAKNRHRFCPEHVHLKAVCAVSDCDRPVVGKTRVCDDPVHASMEKLYKLRGTSRHLLAQTLERARMAHRSQGGGAGITVDFDLSAVHPINGWDDDDDDDDDDEDDDGYPLEAIPEGEYDIADDGTAQDVDRPAPVTSREADAREQCAAGGQQDDTTLGTRPVRRLRALFGRRRTHNEQIIVAPCGVIIARMTFFASESVSAVAEFIRQVYRELRHRPDHVYFDNNCLMRRHLDRANDTWFANIGLSVDPFHFNSKHKKTDQFCQDFCNPASFGELYADDGSWFFNSSIAEQTNVWLANYNSVLREMRVERFNFFLDEMIIRRNRQTIAKLDREGALPVTWPDSQL